MSSCYHVCLFPWQIFGYLAAFIWLASVWFVYKDTVWHKDKTGPLASIYGIVDKEKGTSGEGQWCCTLQLMTHWWSLCTLPHATFGGSPFVVKWVARLLVAVPCSLQFRGGLTDVTLLAACLWPWWWNGFNREVVDYRWTQVMWPDAKHSTGVSGLTLGVNNVD